MRRRIAAGVALACFVGCSRSEAPSSASEAPPAPSDLSAPPTAPAAPAASVDEPAPTDVPNSGPAHATAPAQAARKPAAGPAQEPGPKPAPTTRPNEPHGPRPGSTPRPDDGLPKIEVHANNRFACTGGEKREEVVGVAEPRGARITIAGQGPCPGEVHGWAAELHATRIDVHATHGTPSRCRCTGVGEITLRGVSPGTYDVQVHGGFDRPIATRIVIPQ